MKKVRSTKRVRIAKGEVLTIGSKRFAKISAVEGIVLTRGMKLRKAKFERHGTPSEERRLAIIGKYRKG